ncbi:MAG TPA: DUF5939 domain-containing protein [Verrucomicrobiae bacterium]|jgi:class 3 adenylate cyclase|nr:DUF5939 domain-containing protein [Verrucomicrobiae bacterium]
MKPFQYHWRWDLKSSREALWPFVAETDRFNRDAGLPEVRSASPEDKTFENRRKILGFKILGLPVEWDEEPFEWIYPARFSILRRYRKGPLDWMKAEAEFEPLQPSGTRLHYKITAMPRNLLGLFSIPVQVGRVYASAFDKVFRRYDALAAEKRAAPQAPAVPSSPLEPRAGELLKTLEQKTVADGGDPAVAAALAAYLGAADAMELRHVRPYAFADARGLSRRRTLETFLFATRAGMLEMTWRVLCPLCRGSAADNQSLSDVREAQHCASCRIDYSANFDQFVELTFRPVPSLRTIPEQLFCVGGPQLTPHIRIQVLLKPGEAREVKACLEPGRYRMRALKIPGGRMADVTRSDSEAAYEVSLPEKNWPEAPASIQASCAWKISNPTKTEQLFVFERMAWNDDAATAAEVIALQTFRDLFSREALRPGEQISVGAVTLLFTDLKGSTRLYREVGDAPAFGAVMEHFKLLREIIGRHGGAVVKTIGDSVMAVFMRPLPALQAMLEAQARLALPAEGIRPLRLKAGIHNGPCIAVTLNEKLDYFGSTTNLAARLTGVSTGEDIVISESVHQDPEVDAFVAARTGCEVKEFEAGLKGFENEPFRLYRIGFSSDEERRNFVREISSVTVLNPVG